MNLIKTLIDRLTKIDRIKFDEFDKNYNKNNKIVKQYLKIILKDVDRMMEYPLIAQYEDSLLDMEEQNYNDLLQYLHQDNALSCFGAQEYPDYYEEETDRFAMGLTQLMTFEKLYALYFIYGHKEKEEEYVKLKSRLVMIHDLYKYCLVQYMLYGRGEYIEWNDEAMVCLSDSPIMDLIVKIREIAESSSLMIEAIHENDSAKMNSLWQEFSIVNFVDIIDSPFEL